MNDPTAFWDRLARRSAGAPKPLGGTALATFEAVRPHLTEGGKVLDVGCGPGDLSVAMAEVAGNVHAIDTSPGMVAVARDRAAGAGVRNLTTAASDVFDSGLDGEQYDVVTAFNVLHYVEDVPAFAARAAALLSPDGLFVSATACIADRRSALGALVSVLGKTRLMPAPTRLTSAQLTSLVEGGGLKVAEVRSLSALPDLFVVARGTT